MNYAQIYVTQKPSENAYEETGVKHLCYWNTKEIKRKFKIVIYCVTYMQRRKKDLFKRFFKRFL